MGELTLLVAVSEDRQRTTMHHLVDEDPDHVPEAIRDVLSGPVDVVWAEDGVGQSEEPLGHGQLCFDGQLGDPVAIDRFRNVEFRERARRVPVDGSRGEEHEMADVGVDRRVDEVDAAHEVVLVVEPLDVVAQPFGCVGSQVEDHVERTVSEGSDDILLSADRSSAEARLQAGRCV